MEQAEYNTKVQDMQRFCISAGLNHRVRTVYPYHTGRYGSRVADVPAQIDSAVFEVFYGDWRRLGVQEKPMQPGVNYHYDEIEDMKLRAEVARDLSH